MHLPERSPFNGATKGVHFSLQLFDGEALVGEHDVASFDFQAIKVDHEGVVFPGLDPEDLRSPGNI